MTISEIAKLAGVSSSAVSRYLNGGSLSEGKKKRIGQVIEENNYVPSNFARSLRTKRSNQIGVIVPKINSEAVPRVVSGIAQVLNKHKYQFFLADTNNDYVQEIEYMDALQKNHVDGIILLATIVTAKHREMIQKSQIPIVVIGQELPKCACVYHDDEHASYDLVNLLLDNGCKKLGYLAVTDKDKAAGLARTSGFMRAMEEHGLGEEDFHRVDSGFLIEQGKESMAKLLEEAPDIDGVFCSTDNIAVGAVTELKQRGISIPNDIKICGIGDNLVSSILEPQLTTAHYYFEDSGKAAADILLSMIEEQEEGNRPVKQLMLGYELIRKGSL